MNLLEKRRAIRWLLDDQAPVDGMAIYYAFHHADKKTQLFPYPPATGERAVGYVALSRTGIDLFRPFMTLRLPITDPETSLEVIYGALQPGTAVILSSPERYLPLVRALFAVRSERRLRLYSLDPNQFQPVVSVLVTQSVGANGLPRFVIRNDRGDREVVAAAGLNWQTPHFAEINVQTQSGFQRQGWGKSVVAAMVNYLLENGRRPLYAVAENNLASQKLAESVGFRALAATESLMQATLKPRP